LIDFFLHVILEEDCEQTPEYKVNILKDKDLCRASGLQRRLGQNATLRELLSLLRHNRLKRGIDRRMTSSTVTVTSLRCAKEILNMAMVERGVESTRFVATQFELDQNSGTGGDYEQGARIGLVQADCIGRGAVRDPGAC
jgi:hypothetical protein